MPPGSARPEPSAADSGTRLRGMGRLAVAPGACRRRHPWLSSSASSLPNHRPGLDQQLHQAEARKPRRADPRRSALTRAHGNQPVTTPEACRREPRVRSVAHRVARPRPDARPPGRTSRRHPGEAARRDRPRSRRCRRAGARSPRCLRPGNPVEDRSVDAPRRLAPRGPHGSRSRCRGRAPARPARREREYVPARAAPDVEGGGQGESQHARSRSRRAGAHQRSIGSGITRPHAESSRIGAREPWPPASDGVTSVPHTGIHPVESWRAVPRESRARRMRRHREGVVERVDVAEDREARGTEARAAASRCALGDVRYARRSSAHARNTPRVRAP